MPDEVIQQQETKQTSEVVGLDGSTQNINSSPLASIFDKIEQGKAAGRETKEILQDTSAPKQEQKKEVVVEKKDEAEKKAEPTDLDKKLTSTQEKKDEKALSDREALRKLTEEQKAEKKEEKKEEAKKEDEVPEDELQVLPHDKPKTAKRIQALLKKIETINSEATKTKTEAQEKAAKLAEYEKKLAEVQTVDPRTQEEVKKQLDELAMLRRRYELDKDPEVKKKFDSRLDSAEESIVSTLKGRNAGEALLKAIKEDGGWSGFASSNRVTTIPDGEGGVKQVTHAELADMILQNLPLAERKNIEAAMMEQVQTKREKERFFKEQQETAAEYFKKREEESQKGTVEQQKQIEEAKKTVENWKKSVESQDWMKDKEIPEKATPAEKAAIEEHNKYNAQLRGLLNKAIGTQDLNGMLEIMQDSVRYYDERRNSASLRKEVERLKQEVQAKEQEIVKFKTGGRSVPKSGSISTAATQQHKEAKRPASLEEAFAQLEAGQKLGGEESDE